MPNIKQKLIALLQGAQDKYINLLSFEKELIEEYHFTNADLIRSMSDETLA